MPRVVRRFVTEVIFGIQARQSVRLTEIARPLQEEITLKKTQYRLSRQLSRPALPCCLTWPYLAWLPELLDNKINPIFFFTHYDFTPKSNLSINRGI